MKRLATGLLIVVSLTFVVASLGEQRAPWLGFVRAMAEAAMVGAIADWFAVTALFRHPLGLPIPHTAIIPRRKDIIGASIGRFVQENFLVQEVIQGRLRSVNAAQQAARWIIEPTHSAQLAGLLTAGIGGVVEVLNDADVQALIERTVVGRIRSIRATPLLGQALALVVSERRQAELLDAVLQFAARWVDQNQATIRERINRELPWWLPHTVEKEIYRRLFDAIAATLQEISQDPAHPLRQQFNAALREWIEALKSNPDIITKGEEIKDELLQHPIVRDLSATLWLDLKMWLREQSAQQDSEVQQSIQRAIVHIGAVILEDDVLGQKVNHWIEQIALYAIREYGHEVALLIEQTV
jgi:uncharacterized membrane-anchored protein YjiN (DUF445 family)